MTTTIKNPVLPGFNPDPCMIRVADTYYIAVSSFEWLPGIRVYESKDLVNWDYCTAILTDQVNLQGNGINCSIWAPQLSYADEQFHLVYTDVKSSVRPFKDTHNFLISSPSIYGPWSKPIYLNSSGFDPSLFHDEDGRKWLSNALWDYRLETPNKSSGIVIQEYDPSQEKLIGEAIKIFDRTELGKTEAPHIYKHKGYYYVIMAEGGTGSGHAVTIARSKNVTGPYEVDPDYPMMTASHSPDSTLQCAGHASLVETPDGEWYIAHLATRPLQKNYAILGRETAIQKVYWDEEGWLRLEHGGVAPANDVPAPIGFKGERQENHNDFNADFASDSLQPNWNSLRMLPDESWCSLTEAPGKLRIYGGESLHSLFRHHLLGIRQTDFRFRAETKLTFHPNSYLQMAGLLLFLNSENYLYAYLTDEDGECVLRMMQSVNGNFSILDPAIKVAENNEGVELAITAEAETGYFEYRFSKDSDWLPLAADLDLTFLSGGFTGNFIAIASHDMNQYKGCYADFEKFTYQGKD